MFPPMMPPPGMNAQRMRMMSGGGAQEALAERVEQLESDLDQACAAIEALMQLLEETGTLPKDSTANRAKAILAGEAGVDSAASPAEEDSGPPQPGPGLPVQPVFKKPFVAKRKWDEASGPPGENAK